MNFNLSSVKEYFDLHTKEAAGFILMLLHLEEGEKFTSILGTIEKLEGDMFKLTVGPEAVEQIITLWIEETKEPVEEMFEN